MKVNPPRENKAGREAGKGNKMNEYKVEYSYIKDGKRVYENDFDVDWTASDAAEAVRDANSDLPGLRIEHVWVDTGKAWEAREFDY